jgi:PAS domain S-box-containing protein
VVGHPPLFEIGVRQRREFQEALFKAHTFEDLQSGSLKKTNPTLSSQNQEPRRPTGGRLGQPDWGFRGCASGDARLTPSASEQGAQGSAARTRNPYAREALERFFSLSLDLLCVADFHGHFTRVNPAFERVLGHASEVLLREPFMSFVHPADHAATNAAYAKVLGGADLFGFENRYRCIDGSYRWMQWATTTDREVELIYTVGRDVTEAKTAEAELRGLLAEQEALRRVAMLVAREAEYAEVVAAVAEEVGKLLSAEAARVVRYEPEGRGTVVGEWGRGAARTLHTDARLELDDSTVVGRVYCTGKPAHTTGFARPEGSRPARHDERGYQSSYAAPIYLEGNLWGALALADVGEEPLAEGAEQRLARFSELVAQAIANADARAQLAASRARLVEASDAERRRLERNLHDGAQQRLHALSLTMRLAHKSLPGDPVQAHGLIGTGMEELTAALAELRELARGIHPAVLTDHGLPVALNGVVQRAPLPVELQTVPGERLPGSIEVAAYYLVSEALVNVAKYAHASSASVSVGRHGDHVIVEVSDDGIGGADLHRGSGLRGLNDRIDALGGSLNVESPLRGGTTIRATIPYQHEG